jgi:glycosyltransferase involved in cell wall biosynthesis
MKVLLLLRKLDYGGTERQAVALAKGLYRRGWDVKVLLFYAGGQLQPELEAEGVPVVALGKSSRWDVYSAVMGLRRALDSFRPDVLYTFLDVPNVLGAIVNPARKKARLVWGMRNSGVMPGNRDWFQIAVSWAERRLSDRPALVIANSNAGREHVLRWRVEPGRIALIPNGIDTDRFRPRVETEFHAARAIGSGKDPLVVGVVGRLDPMKGHSILLRAAAQLTRTGANARFECIGGGPAGFAGELKTLARELMIEDRVQWIEPRRDIENAYRRFDLMCSPSLYEGFPNVIGEAMACGVPCVVTDVGDSPLIVGDTGWVVPRGDHEALSRALLLAMQLPCEGLTALGTRARQRIEKEFSVARMVEATAKALACH